MLSDDKKYAVINASVPPFGTKEYHLSDYFGGGIIPLNFNACDNRKEFNCEDGTCISMEMRCDSKFDCPDRSDEDECRVIIIPPSYLQHVPGPYSCFQLLTLFL